MIQRCQGSPASSRRLEKAAGTSRSDSTRILPISRWPAVRRGPITADISKQPEREEAFSEKTSIFFKKTRIYRIPDAKRNILIYLAVSSKIIEGSPGNAVSAVPVTPWPK